MTRGALFRGAMHQATTTQGHLSGQSHSQVQSHSSSARLAGHLSSARPPRVFHTPSVLQRNARTNIACRSENPRSPRMADPSLDLVQTLFEQTTKRYAKVAQELVKEIPAYLPRPNPDAESLEQVFMSVPDLETIPYKVLSKGQGYEIRKVEGYTVAEASMEGPPLGLQASGKAFNVLAGYLFGGNVEAEAMAMTTPVVQIPQPLPPRLGPKTSLSILQPDEGKSAQWTMAFVMPKRSGTLPTPKDSQVRLREVAPCVMAVASFPGIPSNDEILERGRKLRAALAKNSAVRVVTPAGTPPQIAQYNPPFTLPFMRRNEIALEVELIDASSRLQK
mmetsp:Transcript_13928/g.23572  ORF Transcript_13928/g.23572 Transcript_13928/m.23572 type:complete len:334 (+) Transcript_13928:133-1134(+)|eukprot:CAMPEP_0198216426 /NCGR_PEP_ID=MMETSP1445-20131203/57388_1 /TAXON_ID=36898 /ORGANISM="Pyramimonas sp., Strain CCMP2087" /LENGTH=333 /DNA_ID=CAMNT_0043892659 /DNA_START=59 /DNA_END=1060 /DNA_ORIENTATION=+